MQREEIELFKQMCSEVSVLMVDDEVALTNDYKGIAERFFQHVEIANSADEVIKCYDKKKYDIIFTDLNMPGMDGIELIRTIKKLEPKQVFIVISASDESDKLMKLLGLNVSGFILKPFSIDNFIHTSMEQISILKQSNLMEEKTKQLHVELQQVTQEKNDQEEMLIQQSKLAQTGEMISMIAHQWRQPLSSISAVISTLKMRLELDLYQKESNPMDAITSDFYETHAQVENTVGHLSATIKDFRNFYRPDNKKKLFDVCESMQSVFNMLKIQTGEIKMALDCTQSHDKMVFTFESELKQVFMSIINNSIDALNDKSIDSPRISISIEDKDDYIFIYISDNAGGIPESIIKSVFLPYFSTKNEKNGTGLGLYMAKTIIEKHVEGTLDVKNSTIFGGAEFTISIPKSREESL